MTIFHPRAAWAALLFSVALPLTLLGAARPAQSQPGLALPGISGPVSRLFDLDAPQTFPTSDGPVHEEWNRRWVGSAHLNDVALEVAIDKKGNVYVAGRSDKDYSSPTPSGDYRLIKYAPDGTELWNRRYDGPAHGEDDVSGLALDAAGDAYVTGESQGSDGHYDFATLKYAPDGTRLWLRRYEGPAQSDNAANAIALDAAGNAYVTGFSDGSAEEVTTIKYAADDGAPLWVRTFGGAEENDFGFALAVDASGNVAVTGTSQFQKDGVSLQSILTLKYSPDGTLLWHDYFDDNSYGVSPSDNNDYSNSVATDASGNVYVCGTSSIFGPSSILFPSPSYLTLKYAADGSRIWENYYIPTYAVVGEPPSPHASSMTLDPSGNVLVTGNVGTVKYRPDGSEVWANMDPNQNAVGRSIVVTDSVGGVYVVNGDAGVIKLIKYGPDGRQHWERLFTGPSDSSDGANALAVDALGNVYVTGSSYDGTAMKTDMRTIKYSQ